MNYLQQRLAASVARTTGVIASPASLPNAEQLSAVEGGSLAALGIQLLGHASARVFVTRPSTPVGNLRIEARGTDALIVIDNELQGGRFNGNFRIAERDCIVVLSNVCSHLASFTLVALRSPEQLFFWGRGTSAVGISVEIEGPGRAVMIGDDGLISSGVWIRNHDMHALIDIRTGAVLNPDPVDTVIEPHVWIGQDAMLLNCRKVGFGSVLGAKSLVKGVVPAQSIVAGVPARVVSEGTSWARSRSGFSVAERTLLNRLTQRNAEK